MMGNRQKVIKLINHFLNTLWTWPSRLLQKDLVLQNYGYVNYYEMENDYLICRQAVTNYVVCVIFEHIFTGNVDEKSKEKILIKVERILKKFEDVDTTIKNALRQRDCNNDQYYWYNRYENDFRQNDRNGINWFIRQYSNNKKFEIDIVKKIFKKSQLLLENIIIE